MRDAGKLARIFSALSVNTRVRILQLLKEQPLCVGALAARLNVSSGAVSQHLRILRDADLVMPDRQGYFVHYRINKATLAKWKEMASGLLSAK